MECESGEPVAGCGVLEVGGGAEVEEEVRLVEDHPARVDPVDCGDHAAVERGQLLRVEGGAAVGVHAGRVLRARPGLVHHLVAEDVRLAAHCARQLGHHRRVAVLQPDAARPGGVRPEKLSKARSSAGLPK